MTAVNRSWRERIEARRAEQSEAAALPEPCPTCGAVGDEPCVTASGKVRDSWHRSREAL